MTQNRIKRFVKSDYIFIIVMVGLLSLMTYHSYIYKDTFKGVAKVYDISVRRHSVHYINYKYFVQGKIHYGDKKVNSNEGSKYIGKFFEIEISSKRMEWSKINLEREIFNRNEILDSGFKN